MTARVYVLYVFQRLPQLEETRRVADTAKRTFTEMRNHRGEMGRWGVMLHRLLP